MFITTYVHVHYHTQHTACSTGVLAPGVSGYNDRIHHNSFRLLLCPSVYVRAKHEKDQASRQTHKCVRPIRVSATAPRALRRPAGKWFGAAQKKKKKQVGHHARPRRASATAPRRTGADMCKTGSGTGKCARAKSNTVQRRSNHARTEDQAGREKRANTDAAGGWRVHTTVDTPRRNAATRSKHLSFMCQGDIRPRAAAGSSRNGTTQVGPGCRRCQCPCGYGYVIIHTYIPVVAATTGTELCRDESKRLETSYQAV